jgi:hypothetical protein
MTFLGTGFGDRISYRSEHERTNQLAAGDFFQLTHSLHQVGE